MPQACAGDPRCGALARIRPGSVASAVSERPRTSPQASAAPASCEAALLNSLTLQWPQRRPPPPGAPNARQCHTEALHAATQHADVEGQRRLATADPVKLGQHLCQGCAVWQELECERHWRARQRQRSDQQTTPKFLAGDATEPDDADVVSLSHIDDDDDSSADADDGGGGGGDEDKYTCIICTPEAMNSEGQNPSYTQNLGHQRTLMISVRSCYKLTAIDK